MDAGCWAGLRCSRRVKRWDLRPLGIQVVCVWLGRVRGVSLGDSRACRWPQPLGFPHLCGCRFASAAPPVAGGGCGRSALRPAVPGPCGPPLGRAAAHSSQVAPTPPCRHHQWFPPVGPAGRCRARAPAISIPVPPCAPCADQRPHPPGFSACPWAPGNSLCPHLSVSLSHLLRPYVILPFTFL